MRALYPEQPAYRTFNLPVSHGHVLSVSEAGSPQGIAALVLHGGPGSGCTPSLRRFFDAQRYRIVCIDQRGAGASRPRGDVAHNTTGHLLEDIERVRETLAIDRWLVVGGSWGATLGLAYAAAEPQAVAGLLLRAVFLARQEDIERFFAGQSFAWASIGDAGQKERRRIALAWWRHECAMSGQSASAEAAGAALDALVDRYLVQSHYLRHSCWLDEPPLLERCAALPHVPTLLLHGTADRVCPPDGARELQRRVPHARLRWAEGAGHDPTHPAMVREMVEALDAYAVGGAFEAAGLQPPSPRPSPRPLSRERERE